MDNYKKRSFRRLNKNCKKNHCPALLQLKLDIRDEIRPKVLKANARKLLGI